MENLAIKHYKNWKFGEKDFFNRNNADEDTLRACACVIKHFTKKFSALQCYIVID